MNDPSGAVFGLTGRFRPEGRPHVKSAQIARPQCRWLRRWSIGESFDENREISPVVLRRWRSVFCAACPLCFFICTALASVAEPMRRPKIGFER